jgi:hypothetical protein
VDQTPYKYSGAVTRRSRNSRSGPPGNRFPLALYAWRLRVRVFQQRSSHPCHASRQLLGTCLDRCLAVNRSSIRHHEMTARRPLVYWRQPCSLHDSKTRCVVEIKQRLEHKVRSVNAVTLLRRELLVLYQFAQLKIAKRSLQRLLFWIWW